MHVDLRMPQGRNRCAVTCCARKVRARGAWALGGSSEPCCLLLTTTGIRKQPARHGDTVRVGSGRAATRRPTWKEIEKMQAARRAPGRRCSSVQLGRAQPLEAAADTQLPIRRRPLLTPRSAGSVLTLNCPTTEHRAKRHPSVASELASCVRRFYAEYTLPATPPHSRPYGRQTPKSVHSNSYLSIWMHPPKRPASRGGRSAASRPRTVR